MSPVTLIKIIMFWPSMNFLMSPALLSLMPTSKHFETSALHVVRDNQRWLKSNGNEIYDD